jgi:hypothetical protein
LIPTAWNLQTQKTVCKIPNFLMLFTCENDKSFYWNHCITENASREWSNFSQFDLTHKALHADVMFL